MCMWRRGRRETTQHNNFQSRSHITIPVHHPSYGRLNSRVAKWTQMSPVLSKSFTLAVLWFPNSWPCDRTMAGGRELWRYKKSDEPRVCDRGWEMFKLWAVTGWKQLPVLAPTATLCNSRIWTGCRKWMTPEWIWLAWLKKQSQILTAGFAEMQTEPHQLACFQLFILSTIYHFSQNKSRAVKRWLEQRQSHQALLEMKVSKVNHFYSRKKVHLSAIINVNVFW